MSSVWGACKINSNHYKYMTMFTRKFFSVILCLGCYVFTSNVFAHVISMNLLMPEAEMTMSNCGMMMDAPIDWEKNTGKTPKPNCFKNCFWDYEGYSYDTVSITSTAKHYTTINNLCIAHANTFDGYKNHSPHAPPDDRCIINGNKIPYITHRNTLKTE